MHMYRFVIPRKHIRSSPLHLLQPHLPLPSLNPKLTQPNPRHNPHKHQHTRNNNSPMLHMRQVQIIRRPRRRANRRKPQHRNNIPSHPMILINTLRVLHTTIKLRHIILREPHNRLDVHKDIKGEAEARVRGFKVFVAGAGFVHFDDDEAGGEGGGAERVEEEVGEGAGALLFGGVGWLEDEGCLDG